MRSSSRRPAAAERCSSMRATYACGRVVAHLVVDVDLVDDRGRELGLSRGTRTTPRRSSAEPGPLDHHRHARGLEPAAQHLRLDLRPLADLDEPVAVVVGIVAGSAVRCVGSSVTSSATRQSAQRLVPARYSEPHDGHHRLGSSTGGECTGVPRYDDGNAGRLDDEESAFTSRRSAARRTRSTPTRSSPRCSPTGSCPPIRPRTPTSSS